MTTVLVVDDVACELQMISGILAKAGFQVIKAADGYEALRFVEEGKLDLMVLDIIMPKINGFEVVRELRSNPKTAKLPVVLCSQKKTKIDKIWGIEQGADAYVTKPFEPQQLLEIVQRLLDKN